METAVKTAMMATAAPEKSSHRIQRVLKVRDYKELVSC